MSSICVERSTPITSAAPDSARKCASCPATATQIEDAQALHVAQQLHKGAVFHRAAPAVLEAPQLRVAGEELRVIIDILRCVFSRPQWRDYNHVRCGVI